MADLELEPLLDSWTIHLRAERKSAGTIKAYVTGVRQYLAYCAREGLPPAIARPVVNAFTAALLDEREATTAALRQLAVRRFSAWLADEDELPADPLLGLKAPSLDEKLTQRLTDDQCAALIKACQGKTFRDRRDEAIVRFMLEAIVRAGEVVSQSVDDFNLTAGTAKVFGKGRRERTVPFGPETGRAVDRYQRMRRTHRLADSPAMWLGERGKRLGYQGLYSTLCGRAEIAGIPDFHPHLTRHTAAQRYRARGGSEEGLMAIGGWRDRATMARYTRATSSERAIAEARGLNLGEF